MSDSDSGGVTPAVPAAPVAEKQGETSRWTPEELAIAKKTGAVLETTTAGLKGKIESVRDDGFLVLVIEGFPGKAFIKKTDLATQPPFRHKYGDRVATPYGWGIVKALRYREERDGGVDYEVALLPMRVYEPLPAGTARQPLATAFMAAKDVKFRSNDFRTAEECFHDAELLRNRGNAAFTSKDFDQAIEHYNKAVEALGAYKGELPLSAMPAMKHAFMDAFLKSLGNIAQASLSKEPPDNEGALSMATEAINFDDEDRFKYRGKNFKRRGLALFNMGQWRLAKESFAEAMKADKSLQSDVKLREKFAEAKAEADKEAAKEKKTWQGAFAKMKEGAAAEDGAAAADGADGGDDSKRVRFVSPDKPSAKAGSAAAAASSAGASSDNKASPASGGGEGDKKRTLFAGHTPHPGKAGGKAKKRRVITGTSDDDDDEGDHAGDDEEIPDLDDDSSNTAIKTKLADADDDEEEAPTSGLQRAMPWLLGAGALALTLGVIAKRKRWI